MTPVDWIFGSLLVAAIIAATKLFFTNIQIEHDKKALTDTVGELTGQIADLAEENAASIKEITQKYEADIRQKDKELKHIRSELALCNQGLDLYRVDSITHDETVSKLEADIVRLKSKIPPAVVPRIP